MDDPQLQAQYDADPTGVMTEAGLSADEQGIVQSRDYESLNAAVNASPDPESYHFQFENFIASTKISFD